jgi:SpoIID/LytB domain protein
VWRSSTKVATTNRLPMQSYLRSVVPSEMPPSWDPAALGAQAVAARTFAARRSNATSWYDTCDTTACQVYRGRGKRSTDGTITSYEYTSTNTAVTATDGQVLTFRFSDGVTRLATTMYSSSNGGYTAASGNGHDYLSAHSDPYDDVSINRRHTWTAQLPVTSLESRFGIHQVQRLQIRRRDGNGKWGGRVLDVRVEGITSGGAYTYVETSGNGIQSARPWPSVSTGLSSNYFTIASTTTGTVTRLAGSNRYATAAAVAARYPSGLEVVYVASGIAFPDALAGAARAAYNDGPLLLTHPTSLPSATREAMVRLNPNRVVVLGGENSVSDSVAQALASLTRSGGMQRVWGPDRYATAASLAGFYATGPSVAYVASGQDYPDALAGAAIAGRDQVPILLTRATSLPSATADALRRLAPARIVVVGGPNAVSAGVLEQLKGLATAGSVARLAGVDRYGTAARVAAEYSSASSAYVASGQNFPDALAGAAIGGRDGAPLLLTRFDSLPAPTKDVLTRLRPNEAFLLGGLEVVTDSVKTAIRTAISG